MLTMPSLPGPRWTAQPRLLRTLLRTPEAVLDELSSSYGPICGIGAGPLRIAVVGSPGLIRELLMQPNDRFRYDTPLSPFPFVVGKRTMLATDGDDHRRLRGSVQEAFSRRRLNQWIPLIVDRTDVAIDAVLADSTASADGHPIDLYPMGRRLLIEIVVRAIFGERLSAHTETIDARFQRIQTYLSSPLYRQIPHPLPFTRRSRVRADRVALDQMIDGAIADSRRIPLVEPRDVLDVLAQRDDLDDAEIRDQVKTVIGAGYDTTASSLAWMLWESTLQPGLWSRLRAEADAALGLPGSGVTPDNASLTALALAARTMRETLRLHPASGIAVRESAVALELGGYTIRRGTLMAWSPYLAGRDPATWTDPLRFDPDRFVDLDEPQRAAADIAWVPFGRGPRMCLGFALAQMELTLIIARVAQRLDLTPVATSPPAASGLVVSKPVGGVPVRVRARDDVSVVSEAAAVVATRNSGADAADDFVPDRAEG